MRQKRHLQGELCSNKPPFDYCFSKRLVPLLSAHVRDMRSSRRMPATCQRSFQSEFKASKWSITRPVAVPARFSCRSTLIVVFSRFSVSQYGAAKPIFQGFRGMVDRIGRERNCGEQQNKSFRGVRNVSHEAGKPL